jgi:hypothetical protein
VISREWGKNREVFTTSGTYPWSFVTLIFHNGQRSLGGTRKTFEQERLTLPEHLSSPTVISGIRVTRSLVLCVCFVNRCLSFCTFSFGHCVVCSWIYGFWLPLWYLSKLFFTWKCLQERNAILYIKHNLLSVVNYQYYNIHNTGNTRIVKITILVIPVL